MPGVLEVLDPTIVWDYPSSSEIPWAGSYRGHDGVKQFFAAILGSSCLIRFSIGREI